MERYLVKKEKGKPKKEDEEEDEENEVEIKGEQDRNEEIKTESQHEEKYYSVKPEFLRVPLDDKGFGVSFTVDQKEESREFFDKYGMVIYRNVLSTQECTTTVEALFKWLETTRPGFMRGDYSTWENKNWPSGIKFGFLSDFPIYHIQESWNNRQNPNVHRAFANIWGQDELWVSFDRFGFMRPTVNITIKGKKTTRAAWRSDEYFLHLDQNPLADPDFARVQGIISLRDNREEDGGFQCVPGFHKYFKEWGTRAVPKSKSHLVNVPEDDPQQQFKQHIPLAKGSILIWDSRLTHGNYPNKSSHPRICQYITMWPARDEDPQVVQKRKGSIESGEMLNSVDMAGTATRPPRWKRRNFVDSTRPEYTPPVLTDLGKKLAGLKKWHEQDQEATDKEADKGKGKERIGKRIKRIKEKEDEEEEEEEDGKKKRKEKEKEKPTKKRKKEDHKATLPRKPAKERELKKAKAEPKSN